MAIIETLSYQSATITSVVSETFRTKTLVLTLDEPYTFVAGQHSIIRVKLDGSFPSSRHYSFSSSPTSGKIEITVAAAQDGQVSNWLCHTARVGDVIEITHPLGNTLVWNSSNTYPLLLIAGGIGITPLMSIIREHRSSGAMSDLAVLYSASTYDDICFKTELFNSNDNERISFTLTDVTPERWQYSKRAIDLPMIRPLIVPNQKIYVCGSYTFVQHVSRLLNDLHIQTENILKENFTLI